MRQKNHVRLLFLCVFILSLVMVVSCGKQGPGPGDDADQAGTSETGLTDAEKQAREEEQRRAEMEEQDIEARKKAEQEARQTEAEAREQFVNEKVYFEFDDSALTSEARDVLRDKIKWLRDNPDQCVTIEGHCDERGTDEYNLALGSRRAESVKKFIVKAGIDAARLSTISYGEERPAVEDSGEDAWAKNRRAEFQFARCR
ncbi:MAG: peptidoglycan-associated lipoprotein Pal [Desulfosalsimonas sp.]